MPCPLIRPLSSARTHTRCAPCECAVCMRLSRPRCAMCAVAEPYAWGDSGNNTCPENAVRIGATEACQRAARVMGKVWAGSDYSSDRPRGCFWNEGTSSSGVFVYFNAHPVGSGSAGRLPLCAVGTAPLAFARGMPCPSVAPHPRFCYTQVSVHPCISNSSFLEFYI